MADTQALDIQTPAAREPVASPTWRRLLALGQALPGELLIVLLPLLLLAYDSSWLFPRPDTVDPWMYVAYFISPKFQLASFGGLYHGTRLPIILPGAALFKVFRPDVALIVLHLGLYYVACFSLYGTLRMLLGRRTALLATLLFGSNAMFISVTGLTHADSFGVSYALLTVWLVTLATQGRYWKPTLFLAGCASALFLFTNLAYLPGAIFFPWLLVTLPRDKASKPLVPGLACVAGGILVTTVCLGATNRMLGSGFLFFRPWVSQMIGMLPHSGVCANPAFTWVLHASWLVLPVAAFLAGLAVWRSGWIDRNDRPVVFRSLIGGFGLVAVSLVGFETLHFIHYLQFSFYSSLLIPSLFVAAGALLGLFVPRWPEDTWRYAAGAAFLLGLGVLLPINGNALRAANVWLLPLGVVGAAGLLLVRPQFAVQHVPAAAVGLLGLANVLISNNFDRFLSACPLERSHVPAGKWVGPWQDPVRGRTAAEAEPSRRRVFRLVAEAYQLLGEADTHKNAHIWYDVNEPHGAVYTGICSTYMWDYRFLSPYFPRLEDLTHQPREIPEMLEKVAILSDSSRDVEAAARESLAAQNRSLEVLEVHDFAGRHGVPIKMTLVRLRHGKGDVAKRD